MCPMEEEFVRLQVCPMEEEFVRLQVCIMGEGFVRLPRRGCGFSYREATMITTTGSLSGLWPHSGCKQNLCTLPFTCRGGVKVGKQPLLALPLLTKLNSFQENKRLDELAMGQGNDHEGGGGIFK